MKIVKIIYTIVIIALCLSILVLPVIAAKGGEGIHDGIMVGADENNGKSHGDKSSGKGDGDTNTPTTPTLQISPDGNRSNTADTLRNISQIPGVKNKSGKDHMASLRDESTAPPGWERNPNEVRDIVHSLLAIENRTNGIGPQISAIAREFNNSANAIEQYENRIKNRDTFSRFFFGDDQQAATELASLTAQNQARINQIENLMNTTALDSDTLAIMEEQLYLLQQKVAFDQQLSTQAKQDRGIFGWFW